MKKRAIPVFPERVAERCSNRARAKIKARRPARKKLARVHRPERQAGFTAARAASARAPARAKAARDPARGGSASIRPMTIPRRNSGNRQQGAILEKKFPPTAHSINPSTLQPSAK
jgi:hypothetical protein